MNGCLSRVGRNMLFGSRAKTTLPTADDALPGRPRRLFTVPTTHAVLGTPLEGPWPDGTEVLYVAMGCFWGVERIFWKLPGVVTTAAGYQGGYTENPTYEETCTGRTGHAETVLVAYDPTVTSPELLLKAFWENHDPTTRNRQGNDIGTAYRSAIFWTTPGQEAAARTTRAAFQDVLTAGRSRRDHDGPGPGQRGGPVLVRRGLPPAVPAQEPQRLLQPRPERAHLPGRRGEPAGPDRGAASRLTPPAQPQLSRPMPEPSPSHHFGSGAKVKVLVSSGGGPQVHPARRGPTTR